MCFSFKAWWWADYSAESITRIIFKLTSRLHTAGYVEREKQKLSQGAGKNLKNWVVWYKFYSPPLQIILINLPLYKRKIMGLQRANGCKDRIDPVPRFETFAADQVIASYRAELLLLVLLNENRKKCNKNYYCKGGIQ